VQFFEIEPLAISSKDIRDRVSRGESIEDVVPPGVAELIEARGFYRDSESPG
jgi:nicotinic acid mononucleotide adenylyltransferase